MQNPLSHAVATNQDLLEHVLGHFTEEQADVRHGECNCGRWVAGHITTSRRGIAKQIECELGGGPWLEHFNIGTSGVISDAWPSMEEIKKDLAESAEKLSAALQDLDPDLLDEPAEFIIPGREPVTVAHNIQFLLGHESMHIGQLIMMGRSHGHERMA